MHTTSVCHQNAQVLRAGMSTSMSEEHFSNPQSFEPERWLRNHPGYSSSIWKFSSTLAWVLISVWITFNYSSAWVWILITGTTQRIHLQTYHLVTGPGWLSQRVLHVETRILKVYTVRTDCTVTGKLSKQQYKMYIQGLRGTEVCKVGTLPYDSQGGWGLPRAIVLDGILWK